ncbi:pseudouridine synthase, partial [Thamnocephalis sphaerospora]
VGLRRVRPYHYVFRTFAKGRWLGRTVLDVFSREFRDRPASYYQKAIESGVITINDQHVACDTIVRNSDMLAHRMHRHEPPVAADEIEIIARTDDMLAINKPASIPLYGRYHYNTVLGILENQLGVEQLFPANRLDRLTSGLMLIALNKHRAKQLEQSLRERRVQKEYICRVLGEFPTERVTCSEPILVVSHKLGLNAVRPIEDGGRECETAFERISYNGRTSVVKCFPKTGRTHQIRVHLQHLGHPIANDPLYANPHIRAVLLARGTTKPADGEDAAKTCTPSTADAMERLLQEANERDEAADAQAAHRCDECQQPILPDPTSDQLCIWLHAAVYAGETAGEHWRYTTRMPTWAADDFDGDHAAVKAANASPQDARAPKHTS